MTQDAFFRASAGTLVVNTDGEILTLERTDKPGSWQAPQGGIRIDEAPYDAALRELEEETGIQSHHVQVLAEYGEWLVYEVPLNTRNEKIGWGQVQKWFLLRILDPSALRLPSEGTAEFSTFRWVVAEDFLTGVWEPRREIYRRLIHKWREIL